MGITTVYFVRHAQSHPTEGIENADWPLSVRGRQQAEDLAPLLLPLEIGHLVSSPFARCLRTIAPFAELGSLTIEVCSDLRERHLGIGLDGDFPSVWRRSWEDFDFAMPGHETSREAKRRFVAAVDRICRDHEGQTIGVCAHGNVIGLLLHHLDESNGRETAEGLTNPDVLRFRVDDGTITWDRAFRLAGLEGVATNPAETLVNRG